MCRAQSHRQTACSAFDESRRSIGGPQRIWHSATAHEQLPIEWHRTVGSRLAKRPGDRTKEAAEGRDWLKRPRERKSAASSGLQAVFVGKATGRGFFPSGFVQEKFHQCIHYRQKRKHPRLSPPSKHSNCLAIGSNETAFCRRSRGRIRHRRRAGRWQRSAD
jgi:hypothetical protein